MSTAHDQKKVVIVGGGYGGIRAALDLAGRRIPGLSITLLADKPHFLYFPTIYRVVTGRSARQVCVPLAQLFAGKPVQVVEDRVTRIDLKKRLLYGGLESPYEYDCLILAIGSETGYFGLPGLPELSYGFKSLNQAMALKQHIHDCLTSLPAETPLEQKTAAARFTIVGGGPTGVELAGKLVDYARQVAVRHSFDPSLITIDLIEAAPRLLPILPADISERVYQRLHRAGVNIYLNRIVTKQEGDQLFLKDMSITTKTVVWTAGVKPNSLLAQTEGLQFDKRGRVEVDQYLQAKGQKQVFVVGDAAATQYSGMAQTANRDGAFVAEHIDRLLSKRQVVPYMAEKPIYAIPVTDGWAAVLWGSLRIFGRPAWWLRQLADLRYFLTILPLGQALSLFLTADGEVESCPICTGQKAAVTAPAEGGSAAAGKAG